jgi:hypothetical protein
MDQAAADVTEQAKQPKYEQDDNYCPEHGVIPFRFGLRFIGIYPEHNAFAKLFRNMFQVILLRQQL